MIIVKINALWCPGCLIMNKTWKKLNKDFSNLNIINLDYDFDSSEVEKYNVGNKLPVVIFLNDEEKEIHRMVGEIPYKELYTYIEGNIK